MEEKFDLVIIGAGPGGYTAAIKAAKSGLKTALIENREVGGTCLNRGCIPTKTLMHSSHLYYEAGGLDKFGIEITGLSFDFNKVQARKEEVVNKIRDGISGLLKANKVTLLSGTASILNQQTVRLTQKGHPLTDEIRTGKILIATGSKPFLPDIEGIHCKGVVTSDELLDGTDKIYKKLVILGGGVIGIEFATIYQEFGCEVEILEGMDRILPSMEREVSQSVAMNLKKRGIKIHTRSRVVKITENKGLCCVYEERSAGLSHQPGTDNDNIEKTEAGKILHAHKILKADGILVAAGRKANTEHLFWEGFSLEMDGDKIKVNPEFETSVKGIYAIGDVIKGTQLAHAAAAQGITAVGHMCNLTPSVNLNVIPSCIYTSPEVAAVGLGEEEAKEKGIKIKTGKYPLSGNAKAVLSLDERSYVKVISDSETGKILGAQIICARATDMIGEFAAAIANGLTVKEMTSVIRPHPTYEEAVTEALEEMEGMAIHLMPNKR